MALNQLRKDESPLRTSEEHPSVKHEDCERAAGHEEIQTHHEVELGNHTSNKLEVQLTDRGRTHSCRGKLRMKSINPMPNCRHLAIELMTI
jgi:hypothetical protein